MRYTGRQTHMRGQAMVELALILPVIAIILVGIVDMGAAYITYLNLGAATAQAARIAAVNGHGTSCPDTTNSDSPDRSVIEAITKADGLDTSLIPAIEIYRPLADGSVDYASGVPVQNIYNPPNFFTTSPPPDKPSSGIYNWYPCSRQPNDTVTQRAESIAVQTSYTFHPPIPIPIFATISMVATSIEHMNPDEGVIPCPVPGWPSDVKVVKGDPNDTITWTAVPGAGSYTVYEDKVILGVPYETNVTTTSPNATMARLGPSAGPSPQFQVSSSNTICHEEGQRSPSVSES